MSKPFSVKYDWGDFDNTSELTSFQKYRIKMLYRDMVQIAIQQTIDEAVEDHANRRDDLEAHKDPDHTFRLDIGGQG